MSIENTLTKGELSKQAEEYINHCLEDKFHNPSLSGCIFQVYSENPLRVSDGIHSIEVDDPTIANSKLKAAFQNANWVTIRGTLIALREWRFNSTYDATNDKLKFDITIEDLECVQESGTTAIKNIIGDVSPLLEASFLKNKFNRLRKHHMAKEFNTHHPIETALELIDSERLATSEVTRLADASHFRGPVIGSLESNKGQFWEYEPLSQNQAKEGISNSRPLHSATEPKNDFDRSQSVNKILYQSLPDYNARLGSQNFDTQTNLFKGLEADLSDEEVNYQGFREKFDNETLNPVIDPKETMEMAEVENTGQKIVEESVQERPPSTKKTLNEIIKQSKERENMNAKHDSKKQTLDGRNEQQRLIKQRDGKKPGPVNQTPEFETLQLINGSLPKSIPQKKPIERSNRSPEKTGRSLIGQLLDRNNKKAERSILPMDLNEYIEIEEDSEKKPPKHSIVDKRNYDAINSNNLKNYTSIAPRKKEKDLLEITDKEYLTSFKEIKPMSREITSTKQNQIFREVIYDSGKKKSLPRVKPLMDDEFVFDLNSKQKKMKTGPSMYAVNPLNKSILIDLSEFKLVKWKTATSSMNPALPSMIRKKENGLRSYDMREDFV